MKYGFICARFWHAPLLKSRANFLCASFWPIIPPENLRKSWFYLYFEQNQAEFSAFGQIFNAILHWKNNVVLPAKACANSIPAFFSLFVGRKKADWRWASFLQSASLFIKWKGSFAGGPSGSLFLMVTSMQCSTNVQPYLLWHKKCTFTLSGRSYFQGARSGRILLPSECQFW